MKYYTTGYIADTTSEVLVSSIGQGGNNCLDQKYGVLYEQVVMT